MELVCRILTVTSVLALPDGMVSPAQLSLQDQLDQELEVLDQELVDLEVLEQVLLLVQAFLEALGL